jgi:hypothetical protein
MIGRQRDNSMVVESLVPLLNGLIDRFIDLEKHKITQRKEMFEKIFEPNFNDLQTVHATYLELFRRLSYELDEVVELPDSVARLTRIKELTTEIEGQRPTLYASRDKVRAFTRVLLKEKGLKKKGLPKEEEILVAAFRTYFETLFRNWNKDEYASDLTTIMEHLNDVLTIKDAEPMSVAVSGRAAVSAALDLQEAWTEVLAAFADLKVRIVSLH